jgi:hypothetical protein
MKRQKVTIVDIGSYEQYIENTMFGISEKELAKRSREPRISLDELRKLFPPI